MTNRARVLILLAALGLFAGALRGQAILTLVSLSALVWVALEWARFQFRVHFELPRLHFQRSVNGVTQCDPAEPAAAAPAVPARVVGSLWAGRKVTIEVRFRKSPFETSAAAKSDRLLSYSSALFKIRPLLHLRDVVPEILEVLPTHDLPQESSRRAEANAPAAIKATGKLELIASKLERWLSSLVEPKSAKLPVANEWTLEDPLSEASFSYSATLRAAGIVTLPGVRLTIEDRYSLFRAHRFVPLRQTFRILPDYFQSGELRPTVKRHNSLPQHGIHRLQREGAGSELLELREYAPGDPPKSIAWKVSARRDQLMTRKYESEVPVRVHLFIDGSLSTRSGGYGKRLLDQINFVAASVAKAATAVGDPIGGMLVDESGIRRLNWMAGDRGFMQLLKSLADFSHAPPPATSTVTHYMMQCAVRLCHERYPELLDRRYHRIPFSFRAATRDRFRVAGVLAQLYRLSPREHVECFYDDQVLALHLQKLLYDAGLPWMAPLFSAAVDPTMSGAKSMKLLGEAIAKAIMHARDNEVFVIFADPLSCAPNLSQILRTIKLAIAKHHRVAFVCPASTFERPQTSVIRPKSRNVNDLLYAAEQVRIRDVSLYLKRELVRLGVAVTFSGEPSAVRLVLDEMDRARDGRSQRQGARA